MVEARDQLVQVPVDNAVLEGNLRIPHGARGLVLFAHGSGSSRHSPRNRLVAEALQRAGLATLLIDLLTRREEDVDNFTAELRFDIALLADRIVAISDWLTVTTKAASLRVGAFGASTGAAAALIAAAERPEKIAAVVSRGGRPDLAEGALPRVQAPTLLIVGGDDVPVLALNRQAEAKLRTEKELVVVPGAGHLFEEAGALERVSILARDWFLRHLDRNQSRAPNQGSPAG